MTVQTTFRSWQSYPLKPDPKKCSPICAAWWDYLRIHWGGQHLGCYARRPIRGGTSISSHGSGAAIDWRYQNPGCGREVMLADALPFLLYNSEELGIQAIHDYAGKRIWRPPGCSGRGTTPSPECGWQANNGPQMHPANTWLHIEVVPSRWGDTRTVAQMLGTAPTPPEPTPQPPEPTPTPPATGVFTVQGYRKEVRQGSQGKMAKMCQQQINLIAGQGVVEDGDFGPQSVAALKNVQTVLLGSSAADGVCGPKTWQAMEDGIKTQAEAGNWG